MSRKFYALLGLAVLLVAAGFYHFIVTGGLRARQRPSQLEARLADALLQLSVPENERSRRNPWDQTAAPLGRELYLKKCAVCHGADGGGNVETGMGLYPPPLDLRAARLKNRTDGELAYFIRNGIRDTGMPAWSLPDEQIWQLVAYLRTLPPTSSPSPAAASTTQQGGYVGSKACQSCHEEIYARWEKTRMANVVRDPRAHPDAILPSLSSGDKGVAFKPDDVALVYGSRWKQRYFKKIGDDYFPLPAQWDVTHQVWRPYFVKDDWWASLYPPDNFKRPTGPLCDGCHSVNYNVETKTVTEWNVGCEKCHGPGETHAKSRLAKDIVNPARLHYVQANDVCIQCHSQGRPLGNPIAGAYYDWPVGYDVGKSLNQFWRLEEHALGSTTFTHFADGTAHKNRMQGNDYVQSLMYTHGVTCATCHDAHGSKNPGLLRKSAKSLCLDCHGPQSPYGPFTNTIEEHTHHAPDSPGSDCVACHMPKVQQTIADVNVRSHTFRFVGPQATETAKVPNACNVCHAEKTAKWAADVMAGWAGRSPWRL